MIGLHAFVRGGLVSVSFISALGIQPSGVYRIWCAIFAGLGLVYVLCPRLAHDRGSRA